MEFFWKGTGIFCAMAVYPADWGRYHTRRGRHGRYSSFGRGFMLTGGSFLGILKAERKNGGRTCSVLPVKTVRRDHFEMSVL